MFEMCLVFFPIFSYYMPIVSYYLCLYTQDNIVLEFFKISKQYGFATYLS